MTSKINFSLKTIRLTELEQKSLESILDIAKKNLTANWILTEQAVADFYLAREPDSQSAVKRNYLVYSDQQPDLKVYYLEINRFGIPSLQKTIQLFNQIANDVNSMISSSTVKHIHCLPHSNEVFNYNCGLLGFLLKPSKMPQIVKLSAENQHALLVCLPDSDTYYSPLSFDELWPYMVNAKTIAVKECEQAILDKLLTKNKLATYSLLKLKWSLALTHSQGKKPVNYADNQAVRLKRWPDMSLPSCAKFIKIIAFMNSKAETLNGIAQQTGVPLAQVYDFYNACSVMNWVENCQTGTKGYKKVKANNRLIINQLSEHLQRNINYSDHHI